MISKRIQGEYTNKYGTKNAVKYIADKAIEIMTNYTTNKTEKAWYINLPDDKELAIAKMQNTQAMNTETTASKIYHYMVSFPAGEKPSDEIMLDIEKNISEALGYKDYQRAVAIHDDTGHYHMHIVINTIHPTKHINRNTPSNDYYIRNDMMRILEKKHNLNIDNGIQKRQENKNYKSIDFEAHTGLESFTTYLKKEIKENALNTNTWQELHQIARKIGVIVKLQGAGLIFKSINSKITVKASTIDRKLSKNNLEQKLGNFTEFERQEKIKRDLNAHREIQITKDIQNPIQHENNANLGVLKQEKFYTPKPIQKNSKTEELWQKFITQKQKNTEIREKNKEVFKNLLEMQKNVSNEIWKNKKLSFHEKNQLQHDLNIKSMKLKYQVYEKNIDALAKPYHLKAQEKLIQLEILRHQNIQKLQNIPVDKENKKGLINEINKIYKKSTTAIKSNLKTEIMQNTHNSHSWVDFLRIEVKQNNMNALEVLQSIERKEKTINAMPYITGIKNKPIILESAKVSKAGKITYEMLDGGLFIDENNKIILIKPSKQAQEQSYILAQKQFGDSMAISGNVKIWQEKHKQNIQNQDIER